MRVLCGWVLMRPPCLGTARQQEIEDMDMALEALRRLASIPPACAQLMVKAERAAEVIDKNLKRWVLFSRCYCKQVHRAMESC
eukprot:57023-Rhodomonas_salina.2